MKALRESDNRDKGEIITYLEERCKALEEKCKALSKENQRLGDLLDWAEEKIRHYEYIIKE
jgi:hypothetical protein